MRPLKENTMWMSTHLSAFTWIYLHEKAGFMRISITDLFAILIYFLASGIDTSNAWNHKFCAVNVVNNFMICCIIKFFCLWDKICVKKAFLDLIKVSQQTSTAAGSCEWLSFWIEFRVKFSAQISRLIFKPHHLKNLFSQHFDHKTFSFSISLSCYEVSMLLESN
jgi:hypothetical protein